VVVPHERVGVDQPQSASRFGQVVIAAQGRCGGPAVVLNLDPHAAGGGPDRDRDGPALQARVAVVDAVGDQFGRQQRRPLGAGMAHPERLPDERPGHADLLGPTADDQAVPGLQFGDRALARRGTTSRDIGKRYRHSSPFATGADTELINDLFMLMICLCKRSAQNLETS
jgi:hypothetical protein